MINVGIIGTGWFSEVHAKILMEMEEVNLAAVCGTSLSKAIDFGEKFGGIKGYGNVKEMLEGERLDAVYLCVPPFAHGAIELQLIKRGIPFFVEKPVGTSMETPEIILSALKEKPVITSVGYHFRYRETAARLKHELEGAVLGMVTGQWMGSMPPVPWWRDLARSGGQLVEQTTHIIDILRYTAGEVEEVTAVFGSRVLEQMHKGVTVPDVGTVTLKMKSGPLAVISNTCILPEGDSKIGIDFYHSKGILQLDQEGLTKRENGIVTEWKDQDSPYVLEARAFIHAIRTGDVSGIKSDYFDACRTQEVAAAAVESARIGSSVRITDDF
ncbi:Gfo/Idh/MocA family protein [Bacillus infantis]|uniref:Gfo/Idh/MocA family protein n=1 Tax=Bacillus infantis TaxID=324767 RepID=UPI003CF356CF